MRSPSRRPAPTEAGQSPLAKRTRPPVEAPPVGGELMSLLQLSQAVHQIQAQAVLDHQLMGIVEDAVTNHAERIDKGRKVQKLQVARMKAVPQQNDNDLKGLVSANDVVVKRVIEETATETATRIQGIIDTVKVDVARLQSL